MAIKAESAWSEGMDIIVSLNGTTVMLHEHPHDFNNGRYGFISKGSVEFTVAEAEALAAQLLDAARISRELDEGMDRLNLQRKE